MSVLDNLMLDWALYYAAIGWAVFPCHTVRDGACSCGKANCEHVAKHPVAFLAPQGFKNATTDPARIRVWWGQFPDANIGFAPAPGFIVVDSDVKPDKDGRETIKRLCEEHAQPYFHQSTVCAQTGGGGMHSFFTGPAGLKCRNSAVAAVDIKTQGGYVLLPPSLHASSRRYEWLVPPDKAPLAPLPDWFAFLLMELQGGESKGKRRASTGGAVLAFEGARNDTLFKLAASLRAKGLTEQALLAALLAENETRCSPPLDESEVRTIAESAGKYPQGIAPAGIHFTEQSVRPYDFTDTGNAQVFARIFRDKAIYVKSVGWLTWDGRVWNDNELDARELAIKLTDQMLYEANVEVKAAGEALTAASVAEDKLAQGEAQERKKKAEAYRAHAKKSRQASRITGLLTLAQALMQVLPDKLDAEPYLLNTPDGVVKLYDLTIMPHDPSLYCTKITNCGISDEGMSMFQDFLRTVTQGEAELASFLQLVAGMAVIGKVFSENLIIALGDGMNGKSALFNALAAVFGSYAGTIAAEVLTTANKNKGAEMATLKGKRLIIAAETEEGARLSSSMVKQLTSTDKIHAERKYKDPEDFAPTHTIVLYTNHLPRVGSTDGGTWRRLVVVPFTAKITATQEVKNFADKLYREAGGAIMAWAIEGAARFIQTGHKLTIPAAVQYSIDQYRQDNDWLGAFLEECCETGPGKQCSGTQLYDAYRFWAERTGEYKRHAKDFKAEMEKRGFKWRKTNRQNIWLGLALRGTGFTVSGGALLR